VVNDKLSLDRDTLRKFRALLHQISVSGLSGKQWGKGNIVSSVEGYINYVLMVKPEAGKQLKDKWLLLLNRDDIKGQARASATQSVIPAAAPPAEENKKDGDKPWWDVV
jgi:RNA-directed DNA polymerase